MEGIFFQTLAEQEKARRIGVNFEPFPDFQQQKPPQAFRPVLLSQLLGQALGPGRRQLVGEGVFLGLKWVDLNARVLA